MTLWDTIMHIIYAAVQRFDPACGDEWKKFIEWSGLTQLREVVSLDGVLCSQIFEELTDEDWKHNVHEDYKTYLFHDLEFLIRKVAGNDRVNILALCQEPSPAEANAFSEPRFVFRGFDLVDSNGGFSALVNCGGFPKAFSPFDLSDHGLLTDYKMALNVKKLLRTEYPEEHHARCELWAIWQMKMNS